MSLLDKTNLLITANAVKAGKLYSVIPASGTGDCTVVRNTTATRINSSGLVASVASNVPRINYTLNTGGEGFILDEPQRTNLIPFSNNFTGTGWGVANAGTGSAPLITGGFSTSPDGTVNATRLILNIGAGTTSSDISELFISNLGNQSGVAETRSIFIKSNTASNYLIYFNKIIFTITATAYTRIQAPIIGVDERYRMYLRGGAGTSSFADLLIFGSQIEQAATISSYIPTNGAAVTRNADVITVAPPAGTVKITTTFSNNTTQVITSIPATFTMPEGLIKQVLMQSSL